MDRSRPTLLPEVNFAYNATRAPGIEHTPFEANFGFSVEESLDLTVEDATLSPGFARRYISRLKLLQEPHALVRSVLQLHKDEMQAR
jgi:hypothetical protein